MKLFLPFGIAAVTTLPLQINAQTYDPTYVPTYAPTAAKLGGDKATTTYAPTMDNSTVTGIPTMDMNQTYAPTTGEASATESNTPTKSPEIAGNPTPPTTVEPSCPSSFSSTIDIDSIATLFYAIVPSNPAESNNGIFCAKLIADSIGWIGIGISPDGEMGGSVAIVGLPDDNSILKYDLGNGFVDPMSEEKQTLRDTSITQQDGQTIMTFTKLLVESDELPILTDGGVNIFIHARGMSNSLGYHGSRMSFEMEFVVDGATSSPTLSPSTLAPVVVPTPWNGRPSLTSSPTIISKSTTSPTAATENDSPTPFPSDSSKTVSALQSSLTENGASSLLSIFNNGGFVPLVALMGLYFVY